MLLNVPMFTDLDKVARQMKCLDLFDNICVMTDSYKASHYLQYPPNTRRVYSYIESRGGRWDRTLLFGIQALIKKFLMRRVTKEMVETAKLFWQLHGEPFNYEGWMYIVENLEGYLPLEIRAIAEGEIVPVRNALVSIENTDDNCFWLTSWVETLLMRLWSPTTVATNSYMAKQVISKALVESCDNPEGEINFRLHDFGMRGTYDADLTGAAHLINFNGTDTTEGIMGAMAYYDAGMCGFSIPAAEHSSIVSWGKDREVDAYRNMLKQFAKPGSLVAIVSDSYDLWNAVDNLWGGELRQEVIDSGATVIVRPDSGDALTVPTRVVQGLDAKFGSTTNSKGFRVLNNVRVIQGDGITCDTIPIIFKNLLAAGYSAENLSTGMGGGLHQVGIDRDTQKFAMKCSAAYIDGKWVDVFKDPITDPGKRSKKGRLSVIRDDNGEWKTVPFLYNDRRDELKVIWRNGQFIREYTFDEIRANANKA